MNAMRPNQDIDKTKNLSTPIAPGTPSLNSQQTTKMDEGVHGVSSPRAIEPGDMEPRDEPFRHWIFTIPNIICMVRLVGSVVMFCVALAGWRVWFLSLFVGLTLSDWIDGKLARWMHQRSDLGARLDSFADSILYASFLFGSFILCYDVLQHELIWMVAAVLSYVITSAAGLVKYGRIPSYHTLSAKRTQGLVLLGGIVLLLGYSVWPLRLAAAAVIYTNMEATTLTWLLPEWRADYPSVWALLRERAAEANRLPENTSTPPPDPPNPASEKTAEADFRKRV